MGTLSDFYQEIKVNGGVTRRLARFQTQVRWSDNRLGQAWDYLEPLLYFGTYYLIFGIGFYRGSVNGQAYLPWLLAGLIPWYALQSIFTKGLTSVKDQLGTLSKTRYPLSVAVMMPLYQEWRRYLAMTGLLLIVLWQSGIGPSWYWLQALYGTLCLGVLVLAFNLINSTLTILVPDYKAAMSALIRLIFYTAGVIVNFEASALPHVVRAALPLSPFNYVINIFRDSYLNQRGFWVNWEYTLFFWGLVGLLLSIGLYLHFAFRDAFNELV